MAKKTTKKAVKKKAATKKTATKKTTKKATKKKKVKKADEAVDGEAPKKKKKRKSRKKKAAVIRHKVFWGVFNHAMKRVALYDYNQKKAAEKRVKDLNDSGKPPHFVQKVKEEVEEVLEAPVE
ncbi:hypothetical protein OAG68_01735 [bacterium]|nr:hypothetical protein [bacterium]